jgi:CRP-like cAMP-binding protein
LGEARLLTIDRKNFLKRVHKDPSLAFRLVRTMSKRIRDLSDEVTRLAVNDKKE